MKKLLSFLLSLIIAISSSFTLTAFAQEKVLTRSQLMDMLVSAADSYNGAKYEDIAAEYDLSKYNPKVTRIEALMMLQRVFKELPPLSNNRLYSVIADTDVSFSDVPDYAKGDIDALIKTGILANTNDHLLHPTAFATDEEVKTLLRRVWMLYGSNERDDFFMANEKESLQKVKIHPGYSYAGATCDMDQEKKERIDTILNEILAGQWEKGSDEQKIKDYYETALAVCSGETKDIALIKGYLNKVDGAQTLSELFEIIYTLNAKTGFSAFLIPEVGRDCNDSATNILWLAPDTSSSDASFYKDSEKVDAIKEYYKTILMMAGESEVKAITAANEIVAYKNALADVQITPEQAVYAESYNNVMTFKDADKALKNIDLATVLKSLGYSVPEKLIVSDLGAFKYLCGFLSDDNLPVLKNVLKSNIIKTYDRYLNIDFYRASEKLNEIIYGEFESKGAEDMARDMLLQSLDTEIGKLYIKKYFTQNDKDTLQKIEKNLVDIYRKRIAGLDWMGAKTKEKAIAKLNAITFKNIWPDYWFTAAEAKYYPHYEIKSLKDGGSLYLNETAIRRALADKNIAKQGQPVDKAEWAGSPLETNAFYYPTENCVYMPAGFLLDPIYNRDASLEAALGSVGSVIGHEITHAFDSNGATMDLNGNLNNWWTDEDYAAFSERCKKMVTLFDRFEAAPGIQVNGELCLTENIADLGCLVVCVEATSQLIAKPDYEQFFKSYADSYRVLYPRQLVSFISESDEHAVDWVRVNVPLMQLEQFYKTYGITKNDGMYLPPKERVSIW